MRFAALILAAGASRRIGPENKLLMNLNGKPLVAHVLDAVQKARAAEVCVVLGHDAGAVRAVLEPRAGPSVRFVMNPVYEEGMASSLVCGLACLSGGHDGVAVCLGDMPFVTPETIDTLFAALRPGDYACVPVRRGEWGNPVVLSATAATAAMKLTGDRGARALLRQQADRVREVAVSADSVLQDIDRRDDLGLS
jgi:molybdenum cofactor cytidylyltransferase